MMNFNRAADAKASMNTADYYYSFTITGIKVYNSHITKRYASVSHFSSEQKSQILQGTRKMGDDVTLMDLKMKRADLVAQSMKIATKIHMIDVKIKAKEEEQRLRDLQQPPQPPPNPVQEKEKPTETFKRKATASKAHFDYYFEHLHRPQQQQQHQRPHFVPVFEESQPKRAKVASSNVFLASLNIKTKADWRNWLKVNHPDKGGKDVELCCKVLELGKSL